MKFNITVTVKPYVKRFLENNYGSPVDFRNHFRENEMFKRMLKKPNYGKEHMYRNEFSLHVHTIEIAISVRDLYRHGWELSKTNIVSFGKYFEKNAKWLMRSVVCTYISFGIPLNIPINKFQTKIRLFQKFPVWEDRWAMRCTLPSTPGHPMAWEQARMLQPEKGCHLSSLSRLPIFMPTPGISP